MIGPPAGYSSLLDLDSFPHLCSLHLLPPLSLPLLFTNFIFFFPLFLCFLLFHIGSLSALPVLLWRLSSPPSLPQVSTERLHPPSQFRCYRIVHCSHLLPLLLFPVSFCPHYYVPWSPSSSGGNFTME
jgi:hypothetical protein